MVNSPKVLCFTTSYNRPKMLRSCIQDIGNQTYKNILHSVNIAYDGDGREEYECLLDDLQFKTHFTFNKNAHQQTNHLNAINVVAYKEFDIFVKIDDDDIYKSQYIENIVNSFKDNDIVTSYIEKQLNGWMIMRGEYKDLGLNPKNSTYGMPMTFAFNQKALSIIKQIKKFYHYEDKMWRDVWSKNNLKHSVINNNENVIWYIHGGNFSTGQFLIKENE